MRKSKEFEVRRSAGSCRIRRPDSPSDLGALLALDHADVILTLQLQPELRAVAEIAAEPHRGIGRDPAAAVEDVGDTAAGNADIERQTVCTELSRDQFALQQTTGVYDRSRRVQPRWCRKQPNSPRTPAIRQRHILCLLPLITDDGIAMG